MAIVTLTPAEIAGWKRAMVAVHREVAPRVGKEVLDAIYKDTGFDTTLLPR